MFSPCEEEAIFVREAETPVWRWIYNCCLFANLGLEDEKSTAAIGLIDQAILDALPSRYRRAADQAIMLYRFFENKEGMNYAPVFTALLGSMDEVSTWTELFDLGFWETPPTRGRSPFSYNYMMNLIVSTYLSKGLLVRRLKPAMPPTVDEQKAWFNPYLVGFSCRDEQAYQKLARVCQPVCVKRGIVTWGTCLQTQ